MTAAAVTCVLFVITCGNIKYFTSYDNAMFRRLV